MQVNNSVNFRQPTSYQNNTNVKNSTGYTSKEERGFMLNEMTEQQNDIAKEVSRQPGEVPEEFAGMSFMDLINSGRCNNPIPTVNQIVSAKNPEDGQIYITYFTDDRITCNRGDGQRAWELNLSLEQADEVRKFFEGYEPDRSEVREYYSDEKLGIVSLKNFWLDMFEGTSKDAYERMKGIARAVPGISLQVQANAINRKVENEDYVIEVSNEIAGCWRIYDKKDNDYYTFDPKNTEIQRNTQTGKMYLITSDDRGGLMDAMPVSNSLYSALSEFMNVEELRTSALSEQYTIVTNEITGIECLRLKGAEGNGSWMLISEEEQQEKLQELADVYRRDYPHLVQSDELAMGMAIAEVNGFAVRTENGIMMISNTGMQYMDDADVSKSWAVQYSTSASNNTFGEIIQAIKSGSICGLNLEKYSIWETFWDENNLAFEKILTDEELLKVVQEKKGAYICQ